MIRSKLVFPAFMDTVLKMQGERLDPILRFYSLFVRHFIVSDTQVLDNRFFQEEPIADNLRHLFLTPGFDGFPFLLVLKRNGESLENALLHHMLKVGTDLEPMQMSCLDQRQRIKLKELIRVGNLTSETFFTYVGYPEDFPRKLEKLIGQADYSNDLGVANFIQKPDRYQNVLFSVLSLPTLMNQFTLETRIAKSILADILKPDYALSIPHLSEAGSGLGRSHVYRWRSKILSKYRDNKTLKNISRAELRKLADGVVACADYAYLRNFADSCQVSLMIDNLHWLPSSAINEMYSLQRPFVEAADDAIERILQIKEGEFDGYGSGYLFSLRSQLDRCGFSNDATWEEIMKIRETKSFDDRLLQVEEAMQCGESERASDLLRNHMIDCCRRLGKKTAFDWSELFPSLLAGGIGAAWGFCTTPQAKFIAATVGFATAGGICLLPIAGKIRKRWRQRALIDFATTPISDLLYSGKNWPWEESG